VKAHVEEDQHTYAKKEGVERSKERRNGGKAIGGRGKMEGSEFSFVRSHTIYFKPPIYVGPDPYRGSYSHFLFLSH